MGPSLSAADFPLDCTFLDTNPTYVTQSSLTVSLKPLVGEDEFKEAPAKLKGYVMVMLQQDTLGYQESLLSFDFETF